MHIRSDIWCLLIMEVHSDINRERDAAEYDIFIVSKVDAHFEEHNDHGNDTPHFDVDMPQLLSILVEDYDVVRLTKLRIQYHRTKEVVDHEIGHPRMHHRKCDMNREEFFIANEVSAVILVYNTVIPEVMNVNYMSKSISYSKLCLHLRNRNPKKATKYLASSW